MSCLLGSLWNKGRRPLRGSDAGAASSEAEATAAFPEFALSRVSAEAKAATVSSLSVIQIQQSSLCSRLVFVSA